MIVTMDWQVGKTLAESNRHLLETKLGADVSFTLPDDCTEGNTVKIEAHTLMLVSRSPVFEAMFYGSLPETKGTSIAIPDLTPAAFRNLLEFTYTDDCTLENLDVTFMTLYAAKKYMIQSLARKCGDFALKQLNVDNACFIFQLAYELDEVALWTKVQLFIEENAPAVFSSNGFLDLDESALIALLCDDKLMILESDLLSHVLQWAAAKLANDEAAGKETDSSSADADKPKTIADVMRPLKHLIRFPMIPSKHLLPLVTEHKLLEAGEVRSILQYQAGQTADCGSLPYTCQPRGHMESARFRVLKNFDVSDLVKSDAAERRKFALQVRAICAKPTTIFAVSIMCGPYVVRVCVYDADDQVVSFTERDFSAWPLKDCCREMCIVLDDPVQCRGADDVKRIEVHISGCSNIYWYDNVICDITRDTKHFKLQHCDPEIISKLHYLVKDVACVETPDVGYDPLVEFLKNSASLFTQQENDWKSKKPRI